MKKTICLIIFLFSAFIVQGGSAPTYKKLPQPIYEKVERKNTSTEKELAPTEKKDTPPKKKAPKAPEFNGTAPNFLIGTGLLIAAISLVSPWLVLGIGLGILLLTLILVLLIDPKSLMPKGRGVVGKFIALILGIILGFVLLMLLIFALILGAAFVIAGIIGAATSPAIGGLAIAAIGVLWLLISLLVYWIRKIRYKKYARTEGKQS